MFNWFKTKKPSFNPLLQAETIQKSIMDLTVPPHLRLEDDLRTKLDAYRARQNQLEAEIIERQRELESLRLCDEATLAAIKMVNVAEPGDTFGGIKYVPKNSSMIGELGEPSKDPFYFTPLRDPDISIEDELEREFLTNGK